MADRTCLHELLDGPVEIAIATRRAYAAHGDGLLGRDLGYRILKRAPRSAAFRASHHRSFGVLSDDAIELRHWS